MTPHIARDDGEKTVTIVAVLSFNLEPRLQYADDVRVPSTFDPPPRTCLTSKTPTYS
jgi:hypothetical protein